MKMMPHSFISQVEYDQVILDTSVEVERVKKYLNGTNAFQIREDEIYDSLVDAMLYEEYAEFELAAVLHYEWSCADIHFSDKGTFDAFYEALGTLGKKLHAELKKSGLYSSGSINYRYGSLLGLDVVLYSHEFYINHVTIPSIIDTPMRTMNTSNLMTMEYQ